MKNFNLLFLFLSVAISAFGNNIEIKSIPLPYKTFQNEVNPTQSKMIMDGDILYVPTSNGIYSLNLNDPRKEWTPQGFVGESVVEFVHSGDEWLAITRNRSQRILLYSSDNGKTFEDRTPYSFMWDEKYCNASRLCQHPEKSNVIYFLSAYTGILKSDDFGETWSVISPRIFLNPTYCGFEIHPLNPDIILQHGENYYILAPKIQISYNGGQDWIWNQDDGNPAIISDIFFPYHGDNCIHDVAFHPTDLNTWVCGGEGIIGKTSDGGKTWEYKKDKLSGYLYSIFYDYNNPDVLYTLGSNNNSIWEFIISSDGGETWKNVYNYPIESNFYHDIKQTNEELIILNNENILIVNKNDLLSLSECRNPQLQQTYYNDVYSIDGSVIKHNITKKELDDLQKGVYIYNRSIVVK